MNPRRMREGLYDAYRCHVGWPSDVQLCGATLRSRERVEWFAAERWPSVRRLSLDVDGLLDAGLAAKLFAAVPNLEELETPHGPRIEHPTARNVQPPARWVSDTRDTYLSIGNLSYDISTFDEMVSRQAEFLSPEALATWQLVLVGSPPEKVPGMHRALSELDDVGWNLELGDEPVAVSRYWWSPY